MPLLALRNFAAQFAYRGEKFDEIGFPIDLGNVALYAPSPSGNMLAVVRTVEAPQREHAHVSSRKDKEKDEGKYKVEIWSGGRISCMISAEGKHGPVYNDGKLLLIPCPTGCRFPCVPIFIIADTEPIAGWFGGVAWLPDESGFVYVAETPAVASGTFWSTKENEQKGIKFEFLEDWGEAYAGRVRPTLFRCDIGKREITELKTVPADISAGQPQVLPDGDTVVFVGWQNVPFKLGVKYCYNRPACACTSACSVDSSSHALQICTRCHLLGGSRAQNFCRNGERTVRCARRESCGTDASFSCRCPRAC